MQLRNILILVLFSCWRLDTAAQAEATDKQRAASIFHAVADRYHNADLLHCDILYRYATEEKPGVWLDSLKGDLRVNHDSYCYDLGKTGFIGNKNLVAVLFHQDKVLYLTRPGSAMRTSNPLAMLDSMLLKNDSVDCHITETKDQQVLTISLQSAHTRKQMTYYIDRHTGFITRMTSLVPAKELYAAAVRDRVENIPSYVIVETDLLNYRQHDFGESELDPNHCFQKDGKHYTPAAPYGSYKIVLGTPDL